MADACLLFVFQSFRSVESNEFVRRSYLAVATPGPEILRSTAKINQRFANNVSD